MANFSQLQKRGENHTKRESEILIREMLRQYEIALRKINREVEIAYTKYLDGVNTDDYFKELAKLGRLIGLQNRVENIYNEYAKRAGINTIEGSRVAFVNNYYRQQYAKAWFSPLASTPIILDFSLVDPVAIELSVYDRLASYNNLDRGKRKSNLKGFLPQGDSPTTIQTLNKAKSWGLGKINNSITQGLILGSSIDTIKRDIANSMGYSTRRAEKIARTEIHKSLNGGQYGSYIDAKDQGLVEHRQILSVRDMRTRQQSAIVDGRKDDKDNLFTYPGGVKVSYPGNSGIAKWDVNDRETTIEVINGITPQLRSGIDPSKFNKDGTRKINPKTGKIYTRAEVRQITSFNSFNTWAKDNGLTHNQYGELVQI